MANGKNNVTYIYSKTLSFYCLYVAMWRSQSETLKVYVGWRLRGKVESEQDPMRGDKALAGQVRPGAMKEILIWHKIFLYKIIII